VSKLHTITLHLVVADAEAAVAAAAAFM